MDDGDAIIDFFIDRTQRPIWEPHPWSVIWSGFKFGGKPGVNYELMLLRLNKSELVWEFPFWKRAMVEVMMDIEGLTNSLLSVTNLILLNLTHSRNMP
eukprot:scaffold19497_cov58-Attheya_sp.AAC.2